MTREHKLALIVGFSLVLLVGVLISDHLSRARQAKIASISPADTGTSALAPPATADPMDALNIALTKPAATSPGSEPRPEAPADSGQLAALPQQDPAPVIIAQGRRPAAAEGTLKEAIEGAGGIIHRAADGTEVFELPPAANMANGPSTVNPGGPSISEAPTIVIAPPPTSPIEFAPAGSAPTGAKPLGTNIPLKVHAVGRGETLFQISSRYYGTGHLWRELARFNGVANKDGIVRAGASLKIPGRDVLLGKAPAQDTKPSPATKAAPAPSTKPEFRYATYTVKKGETLGEISLKVLGTSKRWQELAEYNHLDDEDAITAGTVLKVPLKRG